MPQMVIDQACRIAFRNIAMYVNFRIGQGKWRGLHIARGIDLDIVEIFLDFVILQYLVQIIQFAAQLFIFDKGRVNFFTGKGIDGTAPA